MLTQFGVIQTAREKAKYLVPDPTKWVELNAYPKLEVIATPSTGTNHIDLEACGKRGIKVLSLLNDRDELAEIRASSEFALWHILNALRGGGWRQWKKYDRQPEIMRGRELYEKYVGIVGFGRIGQNVAKWLSVMDVAWIHFDKNLGAERLNAIFDDCDIVLISCELNDETRGMITEKHLSRLKKDAILVNIARAEIIDERALEKWTEKGGIYAADVLHAEVHGNVTSPLLSRSNCYITPHIAGTTIESEKKAARIALTLLRAEINERHKRHPVAKI